MYCKCIVTCIYCYINAYTGNIPQPFNPNKIYFHFYYNTKKIIIQKKTKLSGYFAEYIK